MATTIFLVGAVFSIMLLRQGSKAEATQIFTTCTVTAAGLLGCRQAANAVKSKWQNGNGSEILDP